VKPLAEQSTGISGNLKTSDDTLKMHVIEEEFHRRMFEAEGA